MHHNEANLNRRKSSRKPKDIVSSRQIYRRIKNFAQIQETPSVTVKEISNSAQNDNIIAEVTPNILDVTESSDTDDSIHLNELTTSDITDNRLLTKLRTWALSNNINHIAVTRLLHILSAYHSELPLDSRKLLRTPVTTALKQLANGEFHYFGLRNCLNAFFDHCKSYLFDYVSLSFNIDGLPLFSSSPVQLWPIIGLIKNCDSEPFVLGIFCGTGKPMPLADFLEDFVSELDDLLNHGFDKLGKNYRIQVDTFVCDAPAKAFVKCIKSHNGYSSCDKCNEVGVYLNGRMVFTSTTAPKRTDESFKLQLDADHHTGISPLAQLSIGLVTAFPIDYMHNICLGVMRKLLLFWLKGSLKTRLCNRNVNLISTTLESLRSYMPVEFNRKPRSLSEIQRWKATEFRTFLIYLGPTVLKNIVSTAVYKNFLILHFAVTICLSEKHLQNFGTPKHLFEAFIHHCRVLYGSEFLIYNIHMLCHISDDVSRYGILDNFSAFPFENCLGKLKKLVKSPNKPLQQLCRRVIERNYLLCNVDKKSSFLLEHNNGPVPNSFSFCKQYKKVCHNNTFYSINSYSMSDSYCLVHKTIVVQIQNIVTNSENMFIMGKRFNSRTSLYQYPYDSLDLNISVVDNLSNIMEMWNIKHVSGKCLVYPYNDSFVSFPILHTF